MDRPPACAASRRTGGDGNSRRNEEPPHRDGRPTCVTEQRGASGPPQATTASLGSIAPRADHPGGLTRREVEVLRLAARGLTTQEIADRLDLSVKTADHHIQHIYRKIGVSTRAAAALWATQNVAVG